MSRFFVVLALWALLLALAACGGDSKGTDPAMDTELAEMVDTVVSTYDDLTVCTDKREGATAYVEDEKKADVYKNGFWVVDDSLTKEIESDLEKKSSDGKSNSSGKNNSSNPDVSTVSLASPCKTATGDNCEYGTLTDDRDGQTYKTVKIGEQWWMAENLNYETVAGSSCFNDSAKYCEKYGRLYTWATAVGKSEEECGCVKICNLGEGKVRGLCPEGWHLPDTTEWNALFSAVGGEASAGTMLKSTEGWNDDYDGTSGNGSDAYFFSALPAGYRDYYTGGFYYEGISAGFWSSTEHNSNDAYGLYLDYGNDDTYLYAYNKYYGYSVRCLRD